MKLFRSSNSVEQIYSSESLGIKSNNDWIESKKIKGILMKESNYIKGCQVRGKISMSNKKVSFIFKDTNKVWRREVSCFRRFYWFHIVMSYYKCKSKGIQVGL